MPFLLAKNGVNETASNGDIGPYEFTDIDRTVAERRAPFRSKAAPTVRAVHALQDQAGPARPRKPAGTESALAQYPIDF